MKTRNTQTRPRHVVTFDALARVALDFDKAERDAQTIEDSLIWGTLADFDALENLK